METYKKNITLEESSGAYQNAWIVQTRQHQESKRYKTRLSLGKNKRS